MEISEAEEREMLQERYDLAFLRIGAIPGETACGAEFSTYFATTAEFLLLLDRERTFLREGGLEQAPIEELQRRNGALYADVLPGHYGESYGNPAYAVSRLGATFGAMLSFLYREMRSLIPFVYEERLDEIVIRLELFVEVYTCFVYAWQEEREATGAQSASRRLTVSVIFSPKSCSAKSNTVVVPPHAAALVPAK